MPGNDADLALLAQAARQAGDIARSHFQADPQVWDKPGGAGPVTEADLAVNEMLGEVLCAARPDYGWLSEETEDGAERLGDGPLFIVDPIDGTRAFIEGGKDWSHSLAIARGGQVQAAAVYLPMRDKMYLAQRGGGATLNDQRIRVSDTAALGRANILAARPFAEPQHWRDRKVPPFKRHFRSSLAYRLCLVAEGLFDAMATLRATWEWDIAAGSLIVTEAGGSALTQTGAPLIFNNPMPQVDGVVAGGPVVADLLDRLHPAP